jgi:hypothetical protein
MSIWICIARTLSDVLTILGGRHGCCCIWTRGFKTSRQYYYREDYQKLGIPESASLEEIKAAYFKKVRLIFFYLFIYLYRYLAL